MRYWLLSALAAGVLVQSGAFAQVTYPPADTAAISDQIATMQAAIPVPASSVPPAETVGGAPGATMTFRRGDAVQPRITRAVIGTTAAGGTVAVTWDALPSVPIVVPIPFVASGAVQAPMCFPVAGSVTTTGATVKCFTSQSVTVSILGAVVAPITTAAAGVQVQVFAVPTTN